MNLLCKGQTENTSPHQNINNLLSIIARLAIIAIYFMKNKTIFDLVY